MIEELIVSGKIMQECQYLLRQYLMACGIGMQTVQEILLVDYIYFGLQTGSRIQIQNRQGIILRYFADGFHITLQRICQHIQTTGTDTDAVIELVQGGSNNDCRIGVFIQKGSIEGMQCAIEGVRCPIGHGAHHSITVTVVICAAENHDNIRIGIQQG